MRPAASLRGFTLIELMVVVVVAGILAAVAYPAYQSYVMKSRRGDARTALTSVVQAQERSRSNSASYSSDVGTLLGGSSATSVSSPAGYYTISVTNASASGYEAHAVALSTGLQGGDTACADMYIVANAGNFNYRDSVTGTSVTKSPCWPQ